MRECVWDKKLKSDVHISETETKMARILKTDTEETLLNAIKNDEVFGFALCSVRTDESDIEKMVKHGYLFPPVIKKQEVKFSDACDAIQPFIRQKNKNKTAKTLIQTYNGDNLFIMTPTLKLVFSF